MALETATYISGLVAANPLSSDPKSQGDDHLRLIKATLLATFPNLTGAVTATHTELNYVAGVTSSIQAQFAAMSTQISTGSINAAGVGNALTLTTGNTSSALNAGAIKITAGSATDGGNGGDITLTPGSGGGQAGRVNFVNSNSAKSTVACAFTANVGPTGANAAIQGWLTVKVAGTVRYIPYW